MALFKRKKDKKKSPAGKDKSFDELSQMVDKKEQVEKPAKVSDDKKKRSEKDKKKDKTPRQASRGDARDRRGKDEHGKHDHGEAYKNLVRPVITEKASFLGMYNQYVFEVAPKANKVEIKKAIQKLYGVKPIKINMINMRGKNVRYGRQMGKLKNWKKAIVTLRSGDKIDVYEGV